MFLRAKKGEKMKSLKFLSFIAIMLVSTFTFAGVENCSESNLDSCTDAVVCQKLNTAAKVFVFSADTKKCILTECKDGLVLKDKACVPDICSNKETSKRESGSNKPTGKDAGTTGEAVIVH